MPKETKSGARDASDHSLCLRGAFIITDVRFIQMEDGPRSRFGIFGVDVSILHGLNGKILYEADDLYFPLVVFRTFFDTLRLLIEKGEGVAELASIGRTFVLSTYKREQNFRQTIKICEYMGIGEEDVFLQADLTVGNERVLEEWSESVRIFIDNIQDWYRDGLL
jgi:hypothetical protein